MELYHPKILVVGVVFLVAFCGVCVITADILQPQDPVSYYDVYLEASEDGYRRIEFYYTEDIEKAGWSVEIDQDDTNQEILLARLRHPQDGFYYNFYVVYSNGTITEYNRSYIDYGVDREVLTQNDVVIKISQRFNRYVESSEQISNESWTTMPIFMGGMFTLYISGASFYSAFDPRGYK